MRDPVHAEPEPNAPTRASSAICKMTMAIINSIRPKPSSEVICCASVFI